MTLKTLIEEKKKELDLYKPLSFEIEKNLMDWYCVEFTYSSNAIEGNSLTRQETALVIQKGLTGSSKPLIDYLEARNHADAFEFILNLIAKKNITISESTLLRLHWYILKGINDPCAGVYRKTAVRIKKSMTVFPNSAKLPFLIEELINWLKNENGLHPVDLAALAHYKLVSIHPFIDGNGRTARLLMNLILGLHDYPPAVIEVEKRNPYLESLEKAQLGGSINDFLSIIYKAVEDSLDDFLRTLKDSSPESDFGNANSL